MSSLEEIKNAKIKEAMDLYSKLGIDEASDYNVYNFYHNIHMFQDEDEKDNGQKLHWTRLSNTSNVTRTIG